MMQVLIRIYEFESRLKSLLMKSAFPLMISEINCLKVSIFLSLESKKAMRSLGGEHLKLFRDICRSKLNLQFVLFSIK